MHIGSEEWSIGHHQKEIKSYIEDGNLQDKQVKN